MKEETFREYTIRIDRVRDKKKIGKGCWECTDKLFMVDIKSGCGGIGFSVPIKKNYGIALRRVFRGIISALHL